MADSLLREKHIAYIASLNKASESFEYWATNHLRVSGLYWGLAALDLLGALPQDKQKDEIIQFVVACQNPDGGFGGNLNHDSHMLYTLSAIQVLCLFDAVDRMNRHACVKWLASLQQPDGSFAGDEWGEIDTRFSYIALCGLSLLNSLNAVDVAKAAEFIGTCRNFDGGFGNCPGAESHSGQVFCCVAALAIAGKTSQYVDSDLLGWWLAERQTPNGGLNGRPEKLADVCYSWWVLTGLSVLQRLHWIDSAKLREYILKCQDPDKGGIADKPDNTVDVYHTFFGIAGLSLMGLERLPPISAVYALPLNRLPAHLK